MQVEASSLNVESSQAEQVSQALKGEGELLNLTDISLMDLLDNTQWEPDDLGAGQCAAGRLRGL